MSEDLYRAAFEEGADGLFITDPQGRCVVVNRRGVELTGYTRDELAGMALTDLIAPENVAHDQIRFDVLRQGGRIKECAIRRKDGSLLAVEISPRMLPDGNLLGIVRDISSLKKAEAALRENEERLRQAVRVANIGIFDHDHIADTVYWSSQQRKIHGWGPDEPVTLAAFLALVHPEDLEGISEAVRRAHDPASDGFWDVEHRVIRRDGSVRWLTARSQTFFGGEGAARRPLRTVGAVRDITDQKRAEEEREKLQAQLTQAQKMESVGRLAGGVAHDFNNMLSVILGHAELLMHQLDPAAPVHASLQKIQMAAQRSADLTRQMLAFARKQTIAPKVLVLNDAVEGMLKMLRRLIGEDIEVAWKPGRDPWPVKIDPAQVDQILANLLVNARDAIAGKGKVTIATDNVVLDEAFCAEHPGFGPGRYVMLAVGDDGCGMDQATLAHAFEPFFTTKPAGQGTGLGLAMVYGIVRQNDGFIDVDSELGRGTTFKIYLPEHVTTTVPMLEKGPAQEVRGGVETILLVEDEPMVLELKKNLLETLGYTVLLASTPQEAIRQAEEYAGRIHLLVTDVVMPEMNGRDLADRLLSLVPDLKCLFMSGYTADVIARRAVLEEGVHFLQKPFSVQEFAAKVRAVLRS